MIFKTHPKRDLLFVAAVSVLALSPVAILWRKSVLTESRSSSRATSPLAFKPVVARFSVGENSYLSLRVTLSPDGRWLARMEPPAAAAVTTGAASPARSPTPNELVIRSAINGAEAFRARSCGDFAGWTSGSSSFVSKTGNAVIVFNPAVARSGAARPSQRWTQNTLFFQPDSGGVSTSFGSGGSTYSELQTGVIAFSPDFRFAVKGSWGQGPIQWEVADLVTGKIAPPVTVGRWLAHDPNVGGFSSDISIAVAPAGVVAGAKPEVVVWQTTRLLNLSRPVPTPSPIPTPAPTPTFSPAQQAFTAKETREAAQIQALVESVMGVDGADPKITDETEVARIEAEVKGRNRVLAAERARVFPVAPFATPTAAQQSFKEPFQVEAFNLNTTKSLWKTTVPIRIFAPFLQFSPDGRALVALGTTAAHPRNGARSGDDTGLRFLDARTGRLLGQMCEQKEDIGIPGPGQISFYEDPASSSPSSPRSILVFEDDALVTKTVKGQPFDEQIKVLRFFDSRAREVGHLKLDASKLPPGLDQNTFSPSQNGQTWAFGKADCFVAARRDLGSEVSGPLPTPTNTPAPR